MTAAAAAAARPAPLSAAAVRLRVHLRRRWAAQPVGGEPRVVTLGDADAFAHRWPATPNGSR